MKQDLNDIKKLHQSGAFAAAEAAYLEWLQTHSDDTEALHLLGLLYLEQDDDAQAEYYLQKALTSKPSDPTLTIHLCHALKAQRKFAIAIELLVDLVQGYPQLVAGYNNLGAIYFAQQNWQEAAKGFQTAIDLQPDYLDAYYNLGLTLLRLDRREEAVNTFQAILELNSSHLGALFQLGRIFMERKQYEPAIKHYLNLLSQHPFHLESQINLATCYLNLGRSADAMMYYLRALEAAPQEQQVLFNLAVIATQQGKWQDAIDYYQRLLRVLPDSFDAHYNIGILFWQLQDKQKALLHFQEGLRIMPSQQAAQYAVEVLTGGHSMRASPPTYVKALFDSYADHYDQHLSQMLQYQIPTIFLNALDLRPDTKWDVLDLGCGTGLCGVAFKPFSRYLVGVDLSQNMLQQAEQKHIYDELVCDDILAYLEHREAKYDCILLGDVLVYMGDLAQIFALCYARLKPDGLMVFNLEISHQGDYALTDSGRFAHHRDYIERLLREHRFHVKTMTITPMRLQNHLPVNGYLYVLKRQA